MATFAKISEAFPYSTRCTAPLEPTIIAASKVSSVARNPRREFVNRLVRFSSPRPFRLNLSSEAQSSAVIASGGGGFHETSDNLQSLEMEENVEKAIYRCRFLTLFGVFGSLSGSVLCFIKGCTIVAESFVQYFASSGNMILMLVEAVDVYLLGTVMLVFGMGLYELFVSNLDIAKSLSQHKHSHRSNLFGLFTLVERPRWLEIKSVNELKTKLGHVIVMLLLIGLFDKSKKAAIHSPTDLLCFSASVLLSSGCLYLLSKLNGSK